MRSYVNLVEDSTRVMLRIKALFRARAIKTPGMAVYRAAQRKQRLAKLENRGARARAAGLYQELDVLQELRPKAKAAMIAEARRQSGWKALLSIPSRFLPFCWTCSASTGVANICAICCSCTCPIRRVRPTQRGCRGICSEVPQITIGRSSPSRHCASRAHYAQRAAVRRLSPTRACTGREPLLYCAPRSSLYRARFTLVKLRRWAAEETLGCRPRRITPNASVLRPDRSAADACGAVVSRRGRWFRQSPPPSSCGGSRGAPPYGRSPRPSRSTTPGSGSCPSTPLRSDARRSAIRPADGKPRPRGMDRAGRVGFSRSGYDEMLENLIAVSTGSV